ncbi:Uncharacterised protein [Klebsiella pneumoniae]|nr:Uncharacterised protein [Klebsiella pneumoniae]
MLTQALADLIATRFVSIGEQKNKFFATESGNFILLPQATRQCLGNGSEGYISFGMAILVIIGFEEINVGNG